MTNSYEPSFLEKLTDPQKARSLALKTGAVAMAGIVALNSYFTVDESETAVVTRFGEVSRVVGAGFHFKIPMVESPTKYFTGIVSDDVQGSDLNTLTVDSQQIDKAKLRLQYQLPHDEAGLTRVYKELQTNYHEVLRTDGINAFKIAAGKYNSLDIAGKRDKLSQDAKRLYGEAAMKKYGITVLDVGLSDVQLTDKYMGAVENAAIEKTRVEQARLEQEKKRIAAETAKIEAAGTANAAIETARGHAESIKLQATAEANRIDLEGAALARNPTVVELRKVERWNGDVPQVLTLGENTTGTPFLSMFPTAPAPRPAPAPAPGN